MIGHNQHGIRCTPFIQLPRRFLLSHTTVVPHPWITVMRTIRLSGREVSEVSEVSANPNAETVSRAGYMPVHT